MDKGTEEPKDITADKDKFDAILRRIIATKPLPLKDIVGTSLRPRKTKD